MTTVRTKPARRRRLAGSAALAIAITVIDDLTQRGRVSAEAAVANPGHALAAEIMGAVLMAAVLTLIFYVIASAVTVSRH
jgi:hypothetical protein